VNHAGHVHRRFGDLGDIHGTGDVLATVANEDANA
jgi:hypothetical protein